MSSTFPPAAGEIDLTASVALVVQDLISRGVLAKVPPPGPDVIPADVPPLVVTGEPSIARPVPPSLPPHIPTTLDGPSFASTSHSTPYRSQNVLQSIHGAVSLANPSAAPSAGNRAGIRPFEALGQYNHPYAAYVEPPTTMQVSNPTPGPGEFTNVGITPLPESRPEVPKVDFMNPKYFKSMRRELARADAGDAEAREELLAWSRTPHDVANPYTKRHHHRALIAYSLLLYELRPYVPHEDHWKKENVLDAAAYTLGRRVEITKGRFGADHVVAQTVMSWNVALCWLICRYTRDENGNACGMRILVNGLYNHLESTVIAVIRRFKLRRHRRRLKFLYRQDLQKLLETILIRSEEYGRIVKLMEGSSYILCFYTSCRASSLAAGHQTYVDSGNYLRLGDCKFYRKGHCNWSLEIKLDNFKGSITSATGQSELYTIHSPSKAHNALFGPWWVLLYILARGGLEFNNVDDLINCQHATIEVIPEKRDEPFFVKGEPGGRHLVDPPVPMLSDKLSAMLTNTGRNAGYTEDIGLKNFRKGTLDQVSNLYGDTAAEILAKHQSASSTLQNHYSHRSNKFPLTAIMLDEMAPTGRGLDPDALRAHQLHQLSIGLCVKSQLYANTLKASAGEDDGEDEEVDKFTFDASDKIWFREQESDHKGALLGPDLLASVVYWFTKWESLLKPPPDDKPEHDTFNKLIETARDIACGPADVTRTPLLSKAIQRAEDNALKLAEGLESTRQSFLSAVAKRRKKCMFLRRIRVTAVRYTRVTVDPLTTSAQRDAAMAQVSAPSAITVAVAQNVAKSAKRALPAGASTSNTLDTSINTTETSSNAQNPDDSTQPYDAATITELRNTVTSLARRGDEPVTPDNVWNDTMSTSDDVADDELLTRLPPQGSPLAPPSQSNHYSKLQGLMKKTESKVAELPMDDPEEDKEPSQQEAAETRAEVEKDARAAAAENADADQHDIFLGVSVGEATEYMMRVVYSRVVAQSHRDTVIKVGPVGSSPKLSPLTPIIKNEDLTCSLCDPWGTHPLLPITRKRDPKKVWSKGAKFKAHLKTHTPWKDKIVVFVRTGSMQYHCPGTGCTKACSDLSDLTRHGRLEGLCPDPKFWTGIRAYVSNQGSGHASKTNQKNANDDDPDDAEPHAEDDHAADDEQEVSDDDEAANAEAPDADRVWHAPTPEDIYLLTDSSPDAGTTSYLTWVIDHASEVMDVLRLTTNDDIAPLPLSAVRTPELRQLVKDGAKTFGFKIQK